MKKTKAFLVTLALFGYTSILPAYTTSEINLRNDAAKWIEPYANQVVYVQTQHLSENPLTFQKTSLAAKMFVTSFFEQDVPLFGTKVESNTGTGFFVEPGLIATNFHVVSKAQRIWVSTKDGRRVQADLVGFDERLDLALLKVEIVNIAPLVWGDSSQVFPGDMVAAIGNPYNLSWSINIGRVSGALRPSAQSDLPFLQSDVVINPGNSGGPLLNEKGEVIGVNTRILSTSGGFMGIGLSIPSNVARITLKNIKNKTSSTLIEIGASLQTIDFSLKSYFQIPPETQGVVITQIEPNSFSEHLQLKIYDVLTHINDNPIETVTNFGWILGKIPARETVTIRYIRNGKLEKTIPVSPQEWVATQDVTEKPLKSTDPKRPQPKDRIVVKKLENSYDETDQNPPAGLFVQYVTDQNYIFDGLYPNDTILSVNRNTIKDPDEFYSVLEKEENKPILLKIQRNKAKPFFITLH